MVEAFRGMTSRNLWMRPKSYDKREKTMQNPAMKLTLTLIDERSYIG